jgi:serine protease Do
VRAPAAKPKPGASRDDAFFEQFMQQRPQTGPRVSGSGVVIGADGYVLTAEHIVDAADSISVRLADGRTLAATLVGKDRRGGVALLKIPADNLLAALPGDPKKLRLAERVFALGTQPSGRAAAVTDGIVSALEVEGLSAAGYLQTTVPLFPSMGGGPLFNLAGQLVGVNAMMYTRTGSTGLAFAIPIDDAMESVKELRANGRVRRGTLGVTLQEVTAMIAATYGMDGPAGVMVVTVNPGSPAAKAGILQGDLLMRFGAEPVRSVEHAVRLIARTRPGERLTVRVRRMKDVREEDVDVVLGEAPD